MNRSVFIVFLFLAVCKNSYSQEVYLRLDSIVIIENELLTIPHGSYNNYEIGRDTLAINVGANQYVKVRKVSFTIVDPGYDVSFNQSLYELSIGTETNSWLNGLTWGVEKVEGGYQTSGHSIRVDELSLKTLKIESRPDEFLLENEICFVNYYDMDNGYKIYYRIELVYYSHE